jgi:hypothetical protein
MSIPWKTAGKWTLRIGKILLLLAAVLAVAGTCAWPFVYPKLKAYAESPQAQALLSQEVSKALKVEGEFGTLTLEGLTVTSPQFTSKGLPGEAIGGLDAHGVKAVFDPWGILRSVWQIDTIDIGEGAFYLRLPDEALKQPRVKKLRPWYAWLMPQYFNVRWIQTPKALIEFPFPMGGMKGRMRDLELGATMIGQDFKYYGYNGVLEFPLLPDLGIDKLVVYVTRDMADIETAELRGLGADPTRAWITARIGMRDDKSLKARALVTSMPFTQVMPDTLRDRLTGRVTGEVRLDIDKTGKKVRSDGRLQLEGAKLTDWPWLNNLARLQKNPDLQEFGFESAAWDYDYRDERFSISVLDMRIKDKIHLKGGALYDKPSDRLELDMEFDEMPVATWVPAAFKSRISATLRGKLAWKGSFKDWKDSEGTGRINMDGAWMKNPLKRLPVPEAYKRGWQEEVYLENANVEFLFKNQTFDATHFKFSAKEVFELEGSAAWSLDNRFSTRTDFRFSQVEAWVPSMLQGKLDGALSGHLNWTCRDWDFAQGQGDGELRLAGGKLKNFRFQQTLTRFLKDRSFLRLDLAPVRIAWKSTPGGIVIEKASVLAPGKCGLSGDVLIRHDGTLQGKVKVGTRAENLTWLPNATRTVFKEKSRGLHWATVKISGTAENPEHDLTSQIMKQLGKHPIKLAGLALRGLSWWLGDALGTYEPPPAAN